MIDAKPAVTAGNRPAVAGRCATCKEEVVRLGGPPGSQAQPLLAHPLIARNTAVVALPPETTIAPAEMVAVEVATAEMATAEAAGVAQQDVNANEINRIPLSILVKTYIKGIGEVRSRQLAQIGINSLEEMAAAKPEEVSQIKGITMAMATDLIDQARAILGSELRDEGSV
jgi:predicted flap endonuclease-1-like 5' DNA nuclease